MSKALAEGGGNVEIPLSGGSVMTIPADKITYKPDSTHAKKVSAVSDNIPDAPAWKPLPRASVERDGTKVHKRKWVINK